MYSVVLMMAMSGGAETPAYCHGCWGCGCYGGGYSCGWSGCGCYSGGWSSCGCYSGCGGYSASWGCGCYSGSWSCGCYGGSWSGCYGCGGYVGGCCASAHPAPVVKTPPPPPPGKGAPVPPPPPPKKGVNGVNGDNSARATIQVTVPEDAKLTFDSFETTQTSAERTFHTPVLQNGREYFYTLSAETMVDGQSVVKSERVTVRAGQTSRVTFDFGTAGVAAR